VETYKLFTEWNARKRVKMERRKRFRKKKNDKKGESGKQGHRKKGVKK